MKDDKNIEKMLLKDTSYDKLLNTFQEEEFNKTLESTKEAQNFKFITNIKEAPKDRLFTKYATYEVINKSSKTKTKINGIQAEGYLGSKNSIRTSLLSGEVDAFVSQNCYIKFLKVKVNNV
jgi:hypothetical protein